MATQVRVRGRRHFLSRELVAGYLFITPLVVYLLVFQFVPMAITLYYSFTRWNIISPAKWVGLSNYKNLLTNRVLYPNFWPSLLVTARYILFNLPLSLMVPLPLALLLNTKVRCRGVFKTLYYVPCVTSSVAVVAIWKWLLDPMYGLVNRIIAGTPVLELIGQHAWLKEPATVLPSLAAMMAWAGVGGGILIYLAALKAIPEDLYEAAAVDGARGLRLFAHVTFPLLRPAFFFLVVTGLIGGFQTFDAMYLVDSFGGPNGATLTYVLSLYNHAFRYFNEMGTAAAMSYLLLILLAVVTFLNFKFLPQSYE